MESDDDVEGCAQQHDVMIPKQARRDFATATLHSRQSIVHYKTCDTGWEEWMEERTTEAEGKQKVN